MKAALLALLLVGVAQASLSVLDEVKAEHPERVSNRHQEFLDDPMSERASLFFRSMDFNKDKMVDLEDAKANKEMLEEQMPGVSLDQFSSFIEAADQDGDKKLNRDEFFEGLAVGLQSPASLMELQESMERAQVQATTQVGAKKGFFKSVGNFVKKAAGNLLGKVKSTITSIAGNVDKSQDGCVLCQYVVERIQSNLRQSGVLPGLSAGGDVIDSVYLETESQAEGKQVDPYAVAGAQIIGSTRQATRYQRQIERQKYNEIYRVADITLDDVCEQGMPNAYYGFCKTVYKNQGDIVDGLRYQYRPTDICFRVGMCSSSSYITKGIHSRYK